jgi:hypothetical protein
MSSPTALKCVDIQSWRVFTREEMRAYLESTVQQTKAAASRSRYRSILATRRTFSPVDMYCYLKARFGKPNGFQTFLASDSSDNWIHWDYNLKVAGEDVYVSGTYREVHFMLSETLADRDWFRLFEAIKTDFGRVGKDKSAVLRSLEKWIIFPNKYIAVTEICADLHSKVVEDRKLLTPGALDFPWTDEREPQEAHRFRGMVRRVSSLFQNSLELSLITPVMAEAFLNMMILILCRKEVRENARQFDAFLRSQIDAKIFDLPYKCRGFVDKIDPNSETYKNFKRVMDKRNHAIHGNIEPERERIEVVYFEGKRPLFEEPGDHVAKRLEAPFRQYSPEHIVKDYEDTHAFLQSLGDCLEPGLRAEFWQLMEDPYPGYELSRKIVSHGQGMRYDDELRLDEGSGNSSVMI